MKIGIFTDSHYASHSKYKGAYQKIKNALSEFQSKGCELAVCLGDLVDEEDTEEKKGESLQGLATLFDEYPFPTLIILGNHDALNFTEENFYRILGERHRPKNISLKNKRLVFLDTCHYSNGRDYAPGVRDFSEAYFPKLSELFDELSLYKNEDIYIFTHHPIDPAATPHRRITNSEEILSLIKKSSSVKAVFQGHDHKKIISVINGTLFKTYPALFDKDTNFFIEEI